MGQEAHPDSKLKMNSQQTRSIFFNLDWRDTAEGVECKTIAAITLLINGVPAWPLTGEDTDEFEWFADEFLSHLTECWKPLVLRQTYPIAVQPERPSFLFAEAEKRWSELPDATVEVEEREVDAFEDAHNLANAFGGVTGLLPLWFVRDQDEMIIDTQEQCSRVPVQEAVNALVAVGNAIAERLKHADSRKWEKLLQAWMQRDKADGAVLLALVIGRDRKTAETLIQERVLEPPTSVADAANDRDELRIAARMAGPIPIGQVRTVVAKLRECEALKSPKLDDLAASALDFIKTSRLHEARPYVQGNELAKWLRRRLNLPDGRKIDPSRILERDLGVDVRFIEFGIRSLDALAVWGSKHGPAVLLNRNSERVRPSEKIWENGAVRVTAAHEICHFLLDSEHTLSAVEILGGRMPLRIEQRARAFAAEFLLPSDEAANIWRTFGTPVDLEGLRNVIHAICKKHDVTESLAAWQLEHGVQAFHQDTVAQILDQIVPHR
jgi:Zn-dependent peptidase ImmA (M78 family)